MVHTATIRNSGFAALGALALTIAMPVHDAGADAFLAGVAGGIIGSALIGPAYPPPPPPAVVYVDPGVHYGPYYPVYEPPAVVYQPPVVVYEQPPVTYAPPVVVEPKHYRRPLTEYNAKRIHRNHGAPPKVITYDDAVGGGMAEPWSEAWFDYCRSKFRSFDAKTGTYLGYDGQRHFCIVR